MSAPQLSQMCFPISVASSVLIRSAFDSTVLSALCFKRPAVGLVLMNGPTWTIIDRKLL